MTSPGRETVLAYSGGLIDRAASQRNDPGWFSRDELTEYAAAGGRIGREDSIDRYLLRSWLEEAS